MSLKYSVTKNIDRIARAEVCTTYNSYIVRGEKTAVIDIMPQSESECFSGADYLVFTHTAPINAAEVERLIDENTVLVGTTATIRNYKEILNRDFNEYVIKNGGELDLGGAVLSFTVAPNLNQPDTMLVFEKESGTLFSGNLFSSYDTVDGGEWFYGDNLGMYAEYVRSASAAALALQPSRICPCIGDELGAEECSSLYADSDDVNGASIYYSSGCGYTRSMALALAEGLESAGVRTAVFDADRDDIDEMKDALKADILMFGSSTVHRNAARSVWRLISEIDAVRAPSKTAVVFGSYGWSGEGIKIMEGLLRAVKVRLYGKAQTAVYKPTDAQLDELKRFAAELAVKK
jgi:flavorubredoxin